MTGGGAFVDLAEKLADAAAPIHRRYFRAATTVETKADASPVTVADREAETAMRAILAAEVPDHGILGEEYGNQRIDAEYVWVLDPLDGTKSFITGKPTFGTLIGLAHRGLPVLGVMDQPILNERWIGIEGQTTTFNGTSIATRPCGALEQAWLSATSPGMFAGNDFTGFERLRKRVWHTVYGSECLAYGLLAMGFIDLVVEADLKPFDLCALVPVVKGAGGAMTDWQGQPLTLKSDGRVVASGDAGLLDAALAALAG